MSAAMNQPGAINNALKQMAQIEEEEKENWESHLSMALLQS